jgi:hypothetical protein
MRNAERGTRNAERGTAERRNAERRNAERGTRNAERGTRNAERGTRNAERGTAERRNGGTFVHSLCAPITLVSTMRPGAPNLPSCSAGPPQGQIEIVVARRQQVSGTPVGNAGKINSLPGPSRRDNVSAQRVSRKGLHAQTRLAKSASPWHASWRSQWHSRVLPFSY